MGSKGGDVKVDETLEDRILGLKNHTGNIGLLIYHVPLLYLQTPNYQPQTKILYERSE